MSKLFFIGAGKMASAIAGGIVKAGLFKADELAAYDVSPQAAEAFTAATGVRCVSDVDKALEEAENVLIAVKPQYLVAALENFKGKFPGKLVVSIVAGVTLETLSQLTGTSRLVRVMPNTPLLLGVGATGLCPGEGVAADELQSVVDLFATMGEAAVIAEDKLNEVIPVNGSSPAFVYYYIDVLARWAEEQGIDYTTALRLAAKTFEGAARMVLKGDDDPQTLIRKVCSPGGATLEGMAALEKGGADKTLRAAADACVKRAYELGK